VQMNMPRRTGHKNSTDLQLIIHHRFRFQWKLFSSRSNPIPSFPRTTPFNTRHGSTPVVGTIGFEHGRSKHVYAIVCFLGGWRPRPMGWYRVMGLEFVIEIVPTMFRIVVDKQASVPATVEPTRATMKAFGRLVIQDIAGSQNNFMGVSV
jgi:hypothetical protein